MFASLISPPFTVSRTSVRVYSQLNHMIGYLRRSGARVNSRSSLRNYISAVKAPRGERKFWQYTPGGKLLMLTSTSRKAYDSFMLQNSFDSTDGTESRTTKVRDSNHKRTPITKNPSIAIGDLIRHGPQRQKTRTQSLSTTRVLDAEHCDYPMIPYSLLYNREQRHLTTEFEAITYLAVFALDGIICYATQPHRSSRA